MKCHQSLGNGKERPDPISGPPPPPDEEPNSDPQRSGGDKGPKRLTAGTELQHKRYRVEKAVAKGGMGAVYKAFDQHFKRACAVKEMLDNFSNEEERDQSLQWFEREAHMLLDLHHAAIPKVFDFFAENGHNYLVMEFVDGKTLAEVLEQEGQPRGLPEARVRSWAAQMCSVLAYLHSQNPPVIFRDLKPSNIMVTSDDKVKLIDFGIARSFQGGRQATVIMTLGYAPPEQLEGKPVPKSDIYALGATLHRLLTRHEATNNKPSIFDFPTIRSLRPEISPAFDQIIGRALQKEPNARWTSAGEMEQAILRLPLVLPPPGPIGPPPFGVRPPPGVPSGPGGPPLTYQPPPIQPLSGPAASYINQARALLDQRRFIEALNVAQQALQFDQRNPHVYKVLGMIHARSQPPDSTRAMAAYQSALQLAPNDAETHRLIGDVYLFLQRRPTEGIAAYQNALRNNPNDGEAHRLLGQCFEQTNQLEPALAEYREAARLLPRNLAVQMNIGQLCLRLNRLQDAERAFVEALRIDAGSAAARHLLSQVYEREGRLTDALRECEAAVRLNPADTQAQATLQRLRARATTGNLGGPGGPGTTR
ncbi:MAG TPA: protein kinase [Ktedonobacterales bacterium]|nr:protein kinase [Ktedonobacterales bacterium]